MSNATHHPSKRQRSCSEKKIIIHRRDLPLSCPTDAMELWNAHPKVYLPIEKTGIEVCPYCGTVFELARDEGETLA